MSSYTATIRWSRKGEGDFAKGQYSRAHEWAFDGGAMVAASPSPHIVPAPWSDPAGVDPEEAFIASLASCKMAMTRVTLNPRVTWGGDPPDETAVADLHHRAHEACFIANSVTTDVTVEPA